MKLRASSAPPHGENVPVVVGGKRRTAFAPRPLSSLPPPDWGKLTPALGKANRAIGGLRNIDNLLPSPDHFLDGCVLREAICSSQVEGTQSSLDDLLLNEDDKRKNARNRAKTRNDDRDETSNYVAALKRGLQLLQTPPPRGLPLSMRMLLELHAILLKSGRGAKKKPGAFRRAQNWIGDFIHIPPPPNRTAKCMSDLEKFIAKPNPQGDPLVRAGMAHAQFETIHPFLDGNGRMGRLLVVLMLVNEGALDKPWLYVSLPVKKTRQEYYDKLQSTRTSGDWTEWLLYFLRVVAEAAEHAHQTARETGALLRRDHDKITRKVGVQSPAPFAVHKALQRYPISSIPRLQKVTGFSQPTIKHALDRLRKAGIVRLFDDRKWAKRFVYHEYMEILRRDGEPL